MKPTPETDAAVSDHDQKHYKHEVVSAEFARPLERERDKWKAAHDNQVNLRRMLMDRPDLKDRAELVSQISEKNELLERQRNKGIETISALAEELDESRQRNIALILERDMWRAKAEEKIALRRELEALLGMDSMPASDEQFQKGIQCLRSIIEENKALIQLLDKSQ
jgi:hypothetical protein